MEPERQVSGHQGPLGELERLRDTLRVRLHLASLEARSSWHRLESEASNLEREVDRLGAQAGDRLRSAFDGLLEALRNLVAESERSDEATAVRDLMTSPVFTCRVEDSLERAAQLLWDKDCGSLAVVDDDGRAIGMITDRDICMAAYTQGKGLWAATVSAAMSRDLVSCGVEDTWSTALHRMQTYRVRRLPVLDAQGRPIGMVALADIARHVRARATGLSPTPAQAELANALADISDPRPDLLRRSRVASPIDTSA